MRKNFFPKCDEPHLFYSEKLTLRLVSLFVRGRASFQQHWASRMFVKEVTLDNCISGDLCLYHYAASFFPPNLKRMYECLQIKLPIWNRKMLVCLHRNTCIKNCLSIYGHILTSKSTSGDERCLLWMSSDCRCEFSRDAAVCLNSQFIDYPNHRHYHHHYNH